MSGNDIISAGMRGSTPSQDPAIQRITVISDKSDVFEDNNAIKFSNLLSSAFGPNQVAEIRVTDIKTNWQPAEYITDNLNPLLSYKIISMPISFFAVPPGYVMNGYPTDTKFSIMYANWARTYMKSIVVSKETELNNLDSIWQLISGDVRQVIASNISWLTFNDQPDSQQPFKYWRPYFNWTHRNVELKDCPLGYLTANFQQKEGIIASGVYYSYIGGNQDDLAVSSTNRMNGFAMFLMFDTISDFPFAAVSSGVGEVGSIVFTNPYNIKYASLMGLPNDLVMPTVYFSYMDGRCTFNEFAFFKQNSAYTPIGNHSCFIQVTDAPHGTITPQGESGGWTGEEYMALRFLTLINLPTSSLPHPNLALPHTYITQEPVPEGYWNGRIAPIWVRGAKLRICGTRPTFYNPFEYNRPTNQQMIASKEPDFTLTGDRLFVLMDNVSQIGFNQVADQRLQCVAILPSIGLNMTGIYMILDSTTPEYNYRIVHPQSGDLNSNFIQWPSSKVQLYRTSNFYPLMFTPGPENQYPLLIQPMSDETAGSISFLIVNELGYPARIKAPATKMPFTQLDVQLHVLNLANYPQALGQQGYVHRRPKKVVRFYTRRRL